MTIYFRNGENLHIPGREGEMVKGKIAYALEVNMRDWVVIHSLGSDEVIEVIINLADIVAVR